MEALRRRGYWTFYEAVKLDKLEILSNNILVKIKTFLPVRKSRVCDFRMPQKRAARARIPAFQRLGQKVFPVNIP